jgi:DUF917 family protein
MKTVKVTNAELFNSKVQDVDIDMHQGGNRGDVTINGKTHTGEHGQFDYEEEFGFQIVEENE